jgi:hypothetical protein
MSLMRNRTASSPDMRPSFLITIDTEGDNAWSAPAVVSTHNSRFLIRFQALCESYGFKPAYLTNFEMARCPDFQEFGRDVLKREAGEIGMHLHAWNSPPLIPLTTDDLRYCPYLIEYPEQIMREKILVMTELLEDTFGMKMTSHRAGRWSFNATYARLLVEMGYRVDCSVTPHVSWQRQLGDPNQSGGTDYRGFPELPYMLNLKDISQEGHSPLLEVPMTIMNNRTGVSRRMEPFLRPGMGVFRLLNKLSPTVSWLRPNGRNLKKMLRILKSAEDQERDCVEFMLHSSELMPGGSKLFPRDEDIEDLYEDLEQLFNQAARVFKGETLTGFHSSFMGQNLAVQLQKSLTN